MKFLNPSFLKAANVLSVLTLIGSVFIYGGFLSDPTIGDINDRHETLLRPNKYVVSAFWVVELVLLLGFCVIQYQQTLNKPVVEGTSVWLAAANFTISIWAFLWVNEYFILAAIFTFIQWIYLQVPLFNFNRHISLHSPLHNSLVAYFFIRVPLSLYSGWVLPSIFYGISVTYTRQPPDDDPKAYKITAAVFLVLIGLGGVKARKDIYYVSAIALYLLAIGIEQHSEPLITWTCLGMGVLGLLTAGLHKFHSWRLSHERQPLLGH